MSPGELAQMMREKAKEGKSTAPWKHMTPTELAEEMKKGAKKGEEGFENEDAGEEGKSDVEMSQEEVDLPLRPKPDT
jgi:hypothetical protein